MRGTAAAAKIAAADRSTSSARRPPVRDRDAHRVLAVPVGAAEPARAVLLHARDRLARRSPSPMRTSTWLRTTSFSTVAPPASSSSANRRAFAQQRSTSSAMPVAAERADRRVDRRSRGRGARTPASSRPRRARACRRPARDTTRSRSSPRGARRDARRTRARSRTGRSATCAPSVAHESARSLPRSRWRSCGDAAAQRPNAPSTWNHAPASAATSAIASRSSNAPVFTSPACAADDRRAVAEPELVDAHPALVVGRDDLERRRADAEQPQRAVDRDVALRADDDADRRRAGEAVAARRPSRRAASTCVPRRGERGDVRHLTAGDVRDRDVARAGRAARASQPRQTSSTTAADGPPT